MTTARYLGLLAVLVLAALAVRLRDLPADAPTGLSHDFSLTVDGAWYTAAALDTAAGRPPEPLPSYDRPLYSAWVSWVYRWCGPGLAATHLVSVLPALLTILLVASAARALRSRRAGLLAAALLAVNYPFFVFSRSASIHVFTAMLAAVALWATVLGSRRRSIPLALLAWSATLAGVALVKVTLIAIVPCLLLAWPMTEPWRRSPRLALVSLLALTASAAAAGVALGIDERLWQKFYDYVLREQDAGLAARLLSLELRTGLFAAAPVMAGLATIGTLLRRVGPHERPVAAWGLGGLLLFAPLSYSPLRYLLMLFPAFAILAALALDDLLVARRASTGAAEPARQGRPTDQGSTRCRARRVREVCRLALVGYFASQLACASIPLPPAARIGVGLAAAAAALAARSPSPLPLPGLEPTRLWVSAHRALLAAVLGVAAVLPHVTRTAYAHAERSHSILEANREIECVLRPDAVLSGSFAHVLTTENLRARRSLRAVRYGRGELARVYREAGVTHLTLELTETTRGLPALFARDGADLTLVHTFHLRGLPVGVFRFPWAEEICRLSEYEQGVDRLRSGDVAEAERHLRESIRLHSRAAAPRALLAELLAARGVRDEAALWIREALARSPGSVAPHWLSARLLLESGRVQEARAILRRVLRLDPSHRAARELLERLPPAP